MSCFACIRWLALALAAVAASAASPAANPPREASPLPAIASERPSEGAGQRLREGTQLTDVRGRFDFTGDRLTFFPGDSKESFRMLENLALERIGQSLNESRHKQEWIVSGQITEYRGSNYLLVTRALIKPAELQAP